MINYQIKKTVLYTAFIDGVTFYFTKTGYTVSHKEKIKKSKKEMETEAKHLTGKKEENEKEEEKELSFKSVEKFHELKWEGASSTAEIIAEQPVKKLLFLFRSNKRR